MCSGGECTCRGLRQELEALERVLSQRHLQESWLQLQRLVAALSLRLLQKSVDFAWAG